MKKPRKNGRSKTQEMISKPPKRSYLEVYTIIRSKNRDLDDLFVHCGAGYPNKDGSLNISLSSLPRSEELHARSPKNTDPCWLAKPGTRYLVLEPPQGKTPGQNKWKRLGAAFGNNDGSLNVRLNLYPNPSRLRLHIREPHSREGGDVLPPSPPPTKFGADNDE